MTAPTLPCPIRRTLSILALIGTAAGTAQGAAPGDNRRAGPGAELTPFIGYRSGDSFQDPASGDDLDLDEGGDQGVIFNLDHDANTQWEFLYSRQDTELQLAQPFLGRDILDLDIQYFSFGGIYVFHDKAHPGIKPFIGAGIGLTYMSPDGLDSETDPMLNFVAGYKFFLTENFAVRLEARGYATALESDAAIFCGNGACIARVESEGFWQYEANAGLTLRF